MFQECTSLNVVATWELWILTIARALLDVALLNISYPLSGSHLSSNFSPERPRLYGLEKEQPNDLHNIFYRSVRYSIYYNRKKTILPSLKYFTTLVRDELKIKYGANRHLKYDASPTEARALLWMRREMGWSQTIPERMPSVTSN